MAEAVAHAIGAADEEFLAVILDDAGGWRMIPEGRIETLLAGLTHVSSATIARYPRLTLANVYRLIKQGEMTTARASNDSFRNSVDRASLSPDLWTEVNLVGEVLSGYENAPVKREDLLAKEALILSLPSNDHLMLSNVCESLGEKYCDCSWLERAVALREAPRQLAKRCRAIVSGTEAGQRPGWRVVGKASVPHKYTNRSIVEIAARVRDDVAVYDNEYANYVALLLKQLQECCVALRRKVLRDLSDARCSRSAIL